MPRPRTKAEDIKNPEHYFNKYIAMEVKHDQASQTEIEANEYSLEEKIESKAFEYSIAVNKNGELFDDVLFQESAIGWIEQIKNNKLRTVLSHLTSHQQEIVFLLFVKELLPKEIAEKLGITQAAVSIQTKRIMEKIKIFFLTV